MQEENTADGTRNPEGLSPLRSKFRIVDGVRQETYQKRRLCPPASETQFVARGSFPDGR